MSIQQYPPRLNPLPRFHAHNINTRCHVHRDGGALALQLGGGDDAARHVQHSSCALRFLTEDDVDVLLKGEDVDARCHLVQAHHLRGEMQHEASVERAPSLVKA
jgi:hypothetical protein